MVMHVVRQRALVVCLVVAVALLGLATSSFTSLGAALQQTLATSTIKSRIPATVVNQDVTQNGVRVHLSSVEFASDATRLHLELGLVGGTVTPRTFEPIRSADIQVSGIGGDPSSFGMVAQHAVTNDAVPVDLIVGPVHDATAGASVTIARLGVLESSGDYRSVSGPWTFNLSSDEIVSDPVDTTIPLHKTVSANGFTVSLTQAHLSSDAVSVDYTLTGLIDGQVMPSSSPLHLTLPDGRTFDGSLQHGADTSIRGGTMLFPGLPVGTTSFTISFGPFLVSDPNPAAVTFPIPKALATASEGTEVPVSQSFTLGGDQMQVVGISRKNGQVNVAVKNAEPGTQGRVLFVGPDIHGQAVTDDLGNTYQVVGGSTGLQRDKDGVLSAGVSSIRFQGPLATGASTLTIQENHYGRMVDGPDPVTVTVPSK